MNFVDTMFQMLEKYSNNLEELIRERTDQLDMERKKTEQLLNRMLPRYGNKTKLTSPHLTSTNNVLIEKLQFSG